MNENISIKKFIQYLEIKTVHPEPDYKKCAAFLEDYAKELGLEYQAIDLVKGKPIVILTLQGSKPTLPSLILNSHTDVVPVSPEKWTYPPFAAHMTPEGRIYARGSQDMKCVGIWYLEAIRKMRLDNEKIQLKRTLHLTFVPDEEIGGRDGMEIFLKSPEFKQLNAGFALDEGLANEQDAFKVYYGERSPWWIWLTASGNAGHGSKFIEPSASIRLVKVLNHFIKWRDHEQERMERDGLKLGQVTTTNITMLKAGVQMNVVHEKAEAGIDMRVSPLEDFEALRKKVLEWIHSEPGVVAEWKQDFPKSPTTNLTPENKQWQVLQNVASKHQIKLDPEIFPASTDSRFLRLNGIAAFGISAIKNTPVLLHDHDEYLDGQTLLDGIPFYADLISGLANI